MKRYLIKGRSGFNAEDALCREAMNHSRDFQLNDAQLCPLAIAVSRMRAKAPTGWKCAEPVPRQLRFGGELKAEPMK